MPTNRTPTASCTPSSSSSSSPEPFDSERVPVTIGTDIRGFLRVENRVEPDDPRIANLCRVHAFEMAHIKDNYSTGRCVWKFKTALLQWLEQVLRVNLDLRVWVRPWFLSYKIGQTKLGFDQCKCYIPFVN
uniref:Uncharacterized protein n=1 Tax=Vitis vinifera TaxID=29760 RepID=A5BZT0_VITVI|nr:hypothetical protein VITISV_025146 [Vitis vinifera]